MLNVAKQHLKKNFHGYFFGLFTFSDTCVSIIRTLCESDLIQRIIQTEYIYLFDNKNYI